jgi:tetraacyldisaccharide 4'-kinase
MSPLPGLHFAKWPDRHWYRLSAISILLLPIALLFGLAAAVRRLLYRQGLLASRRLPVTVIVVGNLTVGGTGKTPLVLWMAGRLRAAGRKPGIVLRGYGAGSAEPRAVAADDEPAIAGDEAVLLAQRAQCPVWRGRDRARAAMALLDKHADCDLILCDDGLQHYRLARDIEIAVEDERGHGNGLLLPAGPLREPPTRRVDATVVNGAVNFEHKDKARRARAGRMFGMQLRPAGLAYLHGAAIMPEALAGLRLHAVAGIGNPRRFFAMLETMGLEFTAHAFPDHHAFASSDLDFPDCDAVLMTEKDAVKCRAFGRDDLVVLRIDAEPEPAFAEFLLEAIHGRKTA